MTYEIFDNPPRIRCKTCDRISYNPYDVKAKYCGKCNEFHVPDRFQDDSRLLQAAKNLTNDDVPWIVGLFDDKLSIRCKKCGIISTPDLPMTFVNYIRFSFVFRTSHLHCKESDRK